VFVGSLVKEQRKWQRAIDLNFTFWSLIITLLFPQVVHGHVECSPDVSFGALCENFPSSKECEALGYGNERKYEVESGACPPESGSNIIAFNGGGVGSCPIGKTNAFSFQSFQAIDAVLVKAGRDFHRFYIYDSPVTSDDALQSVPGANDSTKK